MENKKIKNPGIALATIFAKTMAMKDMMDWKIPKWPFFLAEVLLIAFGCALIKFAQNLFPHWQWLAVACVGLGVTLGIIPFILDFAAMGKALEVNSLGTVADKIEHLNQFSAQISAATARWAAVQESVGGNAEKTALAAKQISDKMAAEVKEFSEFMKKMNDSEKAALRLEVEKLRRGEAEWLQMLVRILDHIFALYSAAVRSNQPKVAEQIAQFQNACRGTVRRIGLVSFIGEPDEPFDPERHQLADTKQKPFDGAVIAETVGAGYTFQGKLLRPAAVRLREATLPPPVTPAPAKINILGMPQDDLALEES
jgi:molecular chaperone GrpE (heat shock protein)